MIAYFIGGSLDLSKRHVRDEETRFQAAKMPPLKFPFSPEQPPMMVTAEVETYRLVHKRYNGREEIAVFMLDER